MMRKISVVVGVLCLLWSAAALAETVGWRGDGTGRFPNADPPTEWAKDKNIVWASKMPAWSNSSPILVGDKLFVCSEPTDLVCCNAADGKILWKKSHEYFDALSPAELPKAQEIKKQADEITKQLEATRTELFARGAELNKNPGNADLKKKADDLHAQVINIAAKLVPVSQYSSPPAHPDTGYATPTPVSDGKNVYVLAGNGVAACYDLNGNRKWIKIVTKPKSDVGHSASPLLFGDKFIYHIGVPTALNKDTGEELWKGDSPSQCGTPAIARIKGVDALVTPWGNVVRIADGKTLAYFGRGLIHSSPIVVDGVAYLIQNGGGAFSFADEPEDEFKPLELWPTKLVMEGGYYSSPLYNEGIISGINHYAELSAIDAKTGALIYKKRLDLRENVFTSLTLAGNYICASDEHGATVVFKPGREYAQVARNELGDGLRSTPLFAGTRMYVHGFTNLYCIGK